MVFFIVLWCLLRPQILYHVGGANIPTGLECLRGGVAREPRIVLFPDKLRLID